MSQPQRTTATGAPSGICNSIRAKIVTGELRPGDRLTEDVLASEHGVSRIPVREAIRVLVGQGFLRSVPHWGTFVAELDPSEAKDLLAIRSALEPLAASQAAGRRSAKHIADLYALVRLGRQALRAGRFDEFLAVNGEFHDLIAVAANNARLLEMIRQIRYRTDRFNVVDVKGRAVASLHEHEEIVRALEAGNALRARRLVALHVDEAADAYSGRREDGVGPLDPGVHLLEG